MKLPELGTVFVKVFDLFSNQQGIVLGQPVQEACVGKAALDGAARLEGLAKDCNILPGQGARPGRNDTTRMDFWK